MPQDIHNIKAIMVVVVHLESLRNKALLNNAKVLENTLIFH